jgi:hypothetical protein
MPETDQPDYGYAYTVGIDGKLHPLGTLAGPLEITYPPARTADSKPRRAPAPSSMTFDVPLTPELADWWTRLLRWHLAALLRRLLERRRNA